MDNNTKSSILKLRRMRDELCKKQSAWKHAFQVKDSVVLELKNLKSIASDPKTSKEKIITKIESILVLIDSSGKDNSEDENG